MEGLDDLEVHISGRICESLVAVRPHWKLESPLRDFAGFSESWTR